MLQVQLLLTLSTKKDSKIPVDKARLRSHAPKDIA